MWQHTLMTLACFHRLGKSITGNKIGIGRIKHLEMKISAVMCSAIPKTKHDVHVILGLTKIMVRLCSKIEGFCALCDKNLKIGWFLHVPKTIFRSGPTHNLTHMLNIGINLMELF